MARYHTRTLAKVYGAWHIPVFSQTCLEWWPFSMIYIIASPDLFRMVLHHSTLLFSLFLWCGIKNARNYLDLWMSTTLFYCSGENSVQYTMYGIAIQCQLNVSTRDDWDMNHSDLLPYIWKFSSSKNFRQKHFAPKIKQLFYSLMIRAYHTHSHVYR